MPVTLADRQRWRGVVALCAHGGARGGSAPQAIPRRVEHTATRSLRRRVARQGQQTDHLT